MFLFSFLQDSEALIVRQVSLLVWTLLAVLKRRPAAMDKSSVPLAPMRRTVQSQRAAWTLTGHVKITSASLKS